MSLLRRYRLNPYSGRPVTAAALENPRWAALRLSARLANQPRLHRAQWPGAHARTMPLPKRGVWRQRACCQRTVAPVRAAITQVTDQRRPRLGVPGEAESEGGVFGVEKIKIQKFKKHNNLGNMVV